MTYQFEHEPIEHCRNFRDDTECPMFKHRFDGGYCKLSKKWIYETFDELPEGVPEWCELVSVK